MASGVPCGFVIRPAASPSARLALRIEAQQVEDEGRETVFPLVEAENGNQWQLGENEPKPFFFILFLFFSISLHLSALSLLSQPPFVLMLLYCCFCMRERERKSRFLSLVGCEVFHNRAATIPSFEHTAFFFFFFSLHSLTCILSDARKSASI